VWACGGQWAGSRRCRAVWWGGEERHVRYGLRCVVWRLGRAGINALTMQIRYRALRKAHL
jgi:hypothetical protein